MKTLTKTLSKVALLGASVVLAMSANAAVNYGTGSVGQPYVGAKVSQIDTDLASKKAVGYGVYGGYNFDQNFGAEVEFQGSEAKEYTAGPYQFEYDAKAYGAYGTYRYHFANTPFYAKGKLGVAKTEVETKGKNLNYSFKDDTTSMAGGVGLGFQQGGIGVEASYNYLNGDSNAVSLGAHVAF